jgi:lysophospholipid acyltransferase (LPLAT)-like uncharacterized protein
MIGWIRRALARTRDAILGVLVAALAALLGRTLRVRLLAEHGDPGGPVIYAFLHGHQLPLLRYPRPRPTAAIVSLSRDGSLQSRILGLLGFEILRGSSSAGGASALRGSLEWLRQGGDLAMAVDGPRGPAGSAKPGVIYLAEKARACIVPLACSASHGRRLHGAWDAFLLPAPFSTVPIVSATPFRPWEKDWTQKRKLAYLDSLIAQLARRADREAGLKRAHDDPREHRWADRTAG